MHVGTCPEDLMTMLISTDWEPTNQGLILLFDKVNATAARTRECCSSAECTEEGGRGVAEGAEGKLPRAPRLYV